MIRSSKFSILIGLAFVMGLAWTGAALAGKALVVTAKASA